MIKQHLHGPVSMISFIKKDFVAFSLGKSHKGLCSTRFKFKSRPHYAGEITWKTEITLWRCITCFPSTLPRRNLKTHQPPVILNLCLKKAGPGKSHDYRDVIVVEKIRFQNVFCSHENTKPALSNSSGLKSVFEKLRLRCGLVWTVAGLTVEIKLRFQIPLV